MRPFAAFAIVLFAVACGSDPTDPADTGTVDVSTDALGFDAVESDAVESDAIDSDVVLDAPGDTLEDTSDVATTGVSCGSNTCAAGEVCWVECKCCGIDTGNPADQRTDYTCVTPPSGCTGTPAECVAAERGCFASGDFECLSPCA